ncbi:MAG: MarR family transcriptional regulator [Clostridia bacterium]|nr:MarR family transcriptional regulator [Clostridia bacterium]
MKREENESCGCGLPPLNPPMLVNQIARLFHARMREYDLGGGVMSQESAQQIMRVLSRADGCSQLELVHKTHLKAPTVSVALKKMEEEALILRRQDEMDLRVSRVFLTEKGRAYIRSVCEQLSSLDAELMRGFDEEESALLLQFLARMRDNILPADAQSIRK